MKVLILHDYSQLIPAISDLLGFNGYLDKEGEKAREKAGKAYEQALRGFVFAALKKMPDRALLKRQILGELDTMERQQGPCMGEFRVLRIDLAREIDEQAGLGRFRRLARRWAPTVLGVLGVLFYLAAKGFDFLAFLLD